MEYNYNKWNTAFVVKKGSGGDWEGEGAYNWIGYPGTIYSVSPYVTQYDSGEYGYWITPGKSQGRTIALADRTVYFRIPIDLDALIDISSITISGKYTADDGFYGVTITRNDEAPDYADKGGPGSYGLRNDLSADNLASASSAQAGARNYIVWKVRDGGTTHNHGDSPNKTGLLANVTITADCFPPPPELVCNDNNEAELAFETGSGWQVSGAYTGNEWQPAPITNASTTGHHTSWAAGGDWVMPAPYDAGGVTTQAYHFRLPVVLDSRIITSTISIDGTQAAVDNCINSVEITAADTAPTDLNRDTASGHCGFNAVQDLNSSIALANNAAAGKTNYLVWKASNQEDKHSQAGSGDGAPLGLLVKGKIKAQCRPAPTLMLTCNSDNKAMLEYKTGAGWEINGKHTGGAWKSAHIPTEGERNYTAATDQPQFLTPGHDHAIPSIATSAPYSYRAKIWVDPRVKTATLQLAGTQVADNLLNGVKVTQDASAIGGFDASANLGGLTVTATPAPAGAWVAGDYNYLIWQVKNSEATHTKEKPTGLRASGTLTAECTPVAAPAGGSAAVPVNNPWALALLGAAVAGAAARSRRRRGK